MDNIDRSCFDFKQCYRCLVEEYDGERSCKGEEVGYRFDLITNADGSKDVACTNTPGSCNQGGGRFGSQSEIVNPVHNLTFLSNQ